LQFTFRARDAGAFLSIIKQAREATAADFYLHTRLYRAKMRSLRDLAEMQNPRNPLRVLRHWTSSPHKAPTPKAAWDKVPEKLTRLQKTSFMWPDGEARVALETLVEEAKDFMSSQKWYIQRGIPYRKGMLLHGAPKSGKTHFSRLLAGLLGCPIYELELGLGSGITDQNLPGLLRNMAPRSILLLKNIDAYVSQRTLVGVNPDLSFSGILNVLDGALGNTAGQLCLVTTNNYERLVADRMSSDALLRPGRIDRTAVFAKPTLRMVYNFFVWLFKGSTDARASADKNDGPIEAAAAAFCEVWPTERRPATSCAPYRGRGGDDDGGSGSGGEELELDVNDTTFLGFVELRGYLSRFLRAGTIDEASDPLNVSKYLREVYTTRGLAIVAKSNRSNGRANDEGDEQERDEEADQVEAMVQWLKDVRAVCGAADVEAEDALGKVVCTIKRMLAVRRVVWDSEEEGEGRHGEEEEKGGDELPEPASPSHPRRRHSVEDLTASPGHLDTDDEGHSEDSDGE